MTIRSYTWQYRVTYDNTKLHMIIQSYTWQYRVTHDNTELHPTIQSYRIAHDNTELHNTELYMTFVHNNTEFLHGSKELHIPCRIVHDICTWQYRIVHAHDNTELDMTFAHDKLNTESRTTVQNCARQYRIVHECTELRTRVQNCTWRYRIAHDSTELCTTQLHIQDHRKEFQSWCKSYENLNSPSPNIYADWVINSIIYVMCIYIE